MNINKTSHLTTSHMNEIKAFIASCSLNTSISFLENDMNYHSDCPCFYTAYKEDNIVAFLSIFIPDEYTAEIYLHANSLEDSKQLVNEAYKNLASYNFHNIYILFDMQTELSAAIISSAQAQYMSSEFLMQYDIEYEFDTEENDMEYSVDFTHENASFFAYINDEVVGECEAYTGDSFALIHNVLIYEEYRRQGYSTQLLEIVVNELLEQEYTDICLHVNSANTAAFALYSHHGFKTKQSINYYKLI